MASSKYQYANKINDGLDTVLRKSDRSDLARRRGVARGRAPVVKVRGYERPTYRLGGDGATLARLDRLDRALHAVASDLDVRAGRGDRDGAAFIRDRLQAALRLIEDTGTYRRWKKPMAG